MLKRDDIIDRDHYFNPYYGYYNLRNFGRVYRKSGDYFYMRGPDGSMLGIYARPYEDYQYAPIGTDILRRYPWMYPRLRNYKQYKRPKKFGTGIGDYMRDIFTF